MPDDSRAEAHPDHRCAGWAYVSALQLHGHAMLWQLAVATLPVATAEAHFNFIDTVLNDRAY